MKTENRFEIKFIMSNIELIKLKKKYRLNNKMYPTRKITSYYYDTQNFKYFYRSINRDIDSIKYRIRYYNNENNFTEEIKTHTAEGRKKYSRKLKDVREIPKSVIYKNEILYPSSIVSYTRDYFEYKNSRITIDYDLVYKNPKNKSLFESTIRKSNNIVEFKTLNSKSINIYNDIPRYIDSFSKFKDSIINLYNIPYA
jgi:hypothetical protein